MSRTSDYAIDHEREKKERTMSVDMMFKEYRRRLRDLEKRVTDLEHGVKPEQLADGTGVERVE